MDDKYVISTMVNCFEWANQIAQKEVDKSLINLQVIYMYQPTSSSTKLHVPWYKLVIHLSYGSYGDLSYRGPEGHEV